LFDSSIRIFQVKDLDSSEIYHRRKPRKTQEEDQSCIKVMATYTQGHDASRLKAHSWRTAEKCAKYLIPHVRPGMSVLDIGCGPGSITADFAELGPEGRVVGIEISEEPLKMAREIADRRGFKNITYQIGDIHKLDFAD